MQTWKEGKNFKELLAADERIMKYLGQEQLESCFDETNALKHVDHIYSRVGIN